MHACVCTINNDHCSYPFPIFGVDNLHQKIILVLLPFLIITIFYVTKRLNELLDRFNSLNSIITIIIF
jgi:hypothetical protein